VIKTICNKFHGNLETMRNRNQSGKSVMDLVSFFAQYTLYIVFIDVCYVCSSLMCAMLVVHFIFA
jgi:hypothetical protein